MICKHCNAENANGAQFCYSCGKTLADSNKNVMDLYPKYRFVPTSIITIRPLSLIWLLCAVPILYIIILYFIAGIIFFFNSDFVDSAIGIILCFTLSAIVILVAVLRVYPILFKPIQLYNVADYIQDASIKRYLFYVKNGKIGLYDRLKRKIQIEAHYDYLSWKLNNKIIDASNGNMHILIDINGKILK